MKISELRPGAGIELYASIIQKLSLRKLWKCFSCGMQGMWLKTIEFREECPNCKAKISEQPGKGLWLQDLRSVKIQDRTGTTFLDLWHEDAFKYEEGDRIHLINGYARGNNGGGVNVSKGKYGQLVKVE